MRGEFKSRQVFVRCPVHLSRQRCYVKIGLVLSSGGARGFAHIGALRALEEAGLDPEAIAGTSMGGIIGAMVAAGHSADRIMSVAADRSRLRLPSPGRRGGLLGQDAIIDTFCEELPETIEELNRPFAAVAVDISSGEVVVINHGPLRPALCATIAVPGILSPVEIDGRHLVDGGVVNALPIDVIGGMCGARVIAIDVTPVSDRPIQFERRDSMWKRLWNRLTFRSRPLAVDIFLKAFAIQQSLLTAQSVREHPPGIHVRVKMDPSVKLEDFHRLDELVEVGYQSTRDALNESGLGALTA
jgi:NTE family protein